MTRMAREFASSRSRRSSYRKTTPSALAAGEAPLVSVPTASPHPTPATGAARVPEPEIPLAGARPGDVRVEQFTPPVVQEKVISEISHELGNFFHKLYYWSEFLQEKRTGHAADATATQMLERTIRNLEDFLKISLDFFRPLKLSSMRMPVADFVAGVLGQMRAQLNGSPVTVTDPGAWDDWTIQIDPSRLPPVFLVALRRLTEQATAGSSIQITLAVADRAPARGLEVEFRLCDPNVSASLFQTAAAGIEWAIAERIVALHGGELRECPAVEGERMLALFLPFHV
jgi:signal transduction histidine kinase